MNLPTPSLGSEFLVRIVIPAYNESRRLPAYLHELGEESLFQSPSYDWIVVDDGSEATETAAMQASVAAVNKQYGGRVGFLKLPTNQGKGGAVFAGWNELREPGLLAFLDADGAIPAYEVSRLLTLAMKTPERALLASRVKMLGKKIERRFSRHLTGRIFASLVGHYIHAGIYDSQCGFKIIPSHAYRKIKNTLQEKGFVFDVELIAALADSGCEIVEEPIDWCDIPGSKVHFFRDSFRMFQGIQRIARRRKRA